MSRGRQQSTPIEENGLRHPLETPIFVLSVVLNVALLILAFVLVTNASDWLETHPIIARSVKEIRVLAIGLVLAPFALTYARNARRSYLRGNSVAISREQLPEIFAMLERHCAKLRLGSMPGLFLSDQGIQEVSDAFTARGKDFIVISAKYAEKDVERVRDILEFTIARELGRIRLGHTKWYDEFLVSYVARIPVLRGPLQKVRMLSLDRYGAFLVPDGLRGLLVLAAGRKLLQKVNMSDYLKQVDAYQGTWRWMANMGRKDLPVLLRARVLYESGLFNRQADRLRFANESRATGARSMRKGKR